MSLSGLVFRSGSGIRLYRFLIITLLSTLGIVKESWEESWSVCFSCICLYILHALTFVFFSLPLGVKGVRGCVAAACDCGTPLTFLLTISAILKVCPLAILHRILEQMAPFSTNGTLYSVE